ncbi:hypothetical protein GCQ56_00825 [Marinifilum sp. N1E240]|uniref:hypothetical protein n=1 Tax=Marinifilum sp. N1E240 TaxID=2608082 RepID=UPI00128E0369|nr:hypothetical protein [Marinifilum sp. N1E240]MPQ45535.1 hypothetical protein [Marinifilum sp. N1E240]
MRLKGIREIQDTVEVSYDYWLLISFGRVRYNKFDFYREIYVANISSSEASIKSVEEKDIFIIEVQECRAILLKAGMVFNKEGWLMAKIYNKKRATFPVTTVNIFYGKSYNSIGINVFLKQTSYPDMIVSRDDSLGYNPPFYLGYSNDGMNVYIPNFIILSQLYYSLNAIYKLMDLNINFNNMLRVNNDYVIVNNEVYLSLILDLIILIYSNSKVSGLEKLLKGLNGFYCGLMNSKKNNGKLPLDIIVEIPFDIDLTIEVQGEMIKKNVMLVNEVINIKPLHKTDHLFTKSNIYAVYMNFIKESFGAEMPLKLDGVALAHMKNCGIFSEYPFIHYIDKKSIDSYYHRLRLCNEINFDDPSKKLIVNKDDLQFQRTLYELKSLNVKFGFATINNSKDYPYSKLLFKEEEHYIFNGVIELKILIILMKLNSYIVIDLGFEFGIVILKNCGNDLNDRNDDRITGFLNFMMQNNRFKWSEFIKPNIKKNRSLFKHHNTKLIRSKFSFRIVEHCNSLADNTLLQDCFDI